MLLGVSTSVIVDVVHARVHGVCCDVVVIVFIIAHGLYRRPPTGESQGSFVIWWVKKHVCFLMHVPVVSSFVTVRTFYSAVESVVAVFVLHVYFTSLVLR